LCGGLPLALRIAGATLKARPHWTLAHYRGRLAHRRRRLDELRVGGLGLRGTFEEGYEDLPPLGRVGLRRLALLAGSTVRVGAAASLLDADGAAAEEALELLEAAQWLRGVSDGLYQVHDLVRDFTQERMEREEQPEERSRAWLRLLGWYVAAVRAA